MAKSAAARVAAHDIPAAKESFAALLDESLGSAQGLEGSVLSGTVVAIDGEFALVDVGLKSEGRVPLREFGGPAGKA